MRRLLAEDTLAMRSSMKTGSPDDSATVARLKADIDAGRTGDKGRGLDPAAAPLGTDDEAAGTPPLAKTVQQARASAAAPELAGFTGPEDSIAPDAGPGKAVPRPAPWLV